MSYGALGGERVKASMLEGVQFVVDARGKKKAVQLDLDKWGELWEDMYDAMVSRSRRNEPTVSLDALKTELDLETSQVG